MFTGIFTRLSTVTRLKRRVEELETWVAAADRALRKQNELLEELRAGHMKLRGRFYATKPIDEEAAPAGNSREARRAAAFKQLGIVPGRPIKLEN